MVPRTTLVCPLPTVTLREPGKRQNGTAARKHDVVRKDTEGHR
jgi:hypothetical protein